MTQTDVTEIELSEVDSHIKPDSQPVVGAKDISLIQDLPVKLSVTIGDLELSVKSLYELKAGQVVQLDTQVNQPVKLMFDKRLVAEGQLVAVDDHYGVEITALADIAL